MSDKPINKAQMALLTRIAEQDGRLQLLQVTASSGMRNVNALIQRDLAEVANHPTLTGRPSGKPVAALAVTERGRGCLARRPNVEIERQTAAKPLAVRSNDGFGGRKAEPLREHETSGASWRGSAHCLARQRRQRLPSARACEKNSCVLAPTEN